MEKSIQSDLCKIADTLRKLASEQKQTKMIKCAQVAQALIGLMTLRRKLGEGIS